MWLRDQLYIKLGIELGKAEPQMQLIILDKKTAPIKIDILLAGNIARKVMEFRAFILPLVIAIARACSAFSI